MKSWRHAYVVLMISALFCSEAPKEAPLALGISLCAFAYLVVAWLLRMGPIQLNISSFGLFAFFGSIAVSLPVAFLYGTSFRDWLLKGAAPLLFLAIYFLLPLKSEDDAKFVVRTLVFTFFAWAAKIAFGLATAEESWLLVRWTGISYDLLFPFNLAALCILMFDPNFSKKTRMIGIPIFIALTIGAGYRMHFLLLFVFFGYYFSRSMVRGRLLAPLMLIACISAAFAWFVSTEAGEQMVERAYEISNEADSGRTAEIKYAIAQFYESPIVGKGLAYAVPLDIAFYGFEERMAGVTAMMGSDYRSVAYIHNSVMQILMNLGAFGLLGFALFITPAIFGRQSGHLLVGDARTGARWALFLVLAFTLAAATITLFQFNLLVASLVAVLTSRHQITARDISYQTESVES